MSLFPHGPEAEDQEEFVDLRFWEPLWPTLPCVSRPSFFWALWKETLDKLSAVLKETLFLRKRGEKVNLVIFPNSPFNISSGG